MQRHFHEELDALKQTLLAMGGLVEDQIRRVMRALLERDSDLAQEVIDRDRQVNAYDVEIDEKCVELLALHQPTAGDLRFITTAMKIVTDLERIGDQAVNIAQRTIELNPEPQLKPYVDLPRMAEKAQRMVKESLDAFVSRDTELARRVCGEDADVDALKEQIFRELLTYMMEDPKTIPRAIRLILVSRFLERVADHATNIAGDGGLPGREQDGSPHARVTRGPARPREPRSRRLAATLSRAGPESEPAPPGSRDPPLPGAARPPDGSGGWSRAPPDRR